MPRRGEFQGENRKLYCPYSKEFLRGKWPILGKKTAFSTFQTNSRVCLKTGEILDF